MSQRPFRQGLVHSKYQYAVKGMMMLLETKAVTQRRGPGVLRNNSGEGLCRPVSFSPSRLFIQDCSLFHEGRLS